MARDPVSLASKIARASGSPKTADAVMKNAKSVRSWVKGLGKEAQRQFKALIDSPSAGQRQIANAGSKTRAATVKAQKAFAGGYAMSELVDALFGDSEQKSSAQLEKKLDSVYNKASRKDPYSGGVDAITQKALNKNKKSSTAVDFLSDDDFKGRAYIEKSNKSQFEKEFDNARKEGKKTFDFKDKEGKIGSYSTERMDEQIAKEKMYKGGYKKPKKANKGMMNTKKSRTGTMDYRKGGLFK